MQRVLLTNYHSWQCDFKKSSFINLPKISSKAFTLYFQMCNTKIQYDNLFFFYFYATLVPSARSPWAMLHPSQPHANDINGVEHG